MKICFIGYMEVAELLKHANGTERKLETPELASSNLENQAIDQENAPETTSSKAIDPKNIETLEVTSHKTVDPKQ